MATDRSEKKTTKSGQGGAPQEPEHLPCPRCDSTNTKFCYYNNYNFSQPRHFCKSCRRYWTHGGTLRDIPVGGGTRKSAKRSRTSHLPLFSSALVPTHAAAVPFTTLLSASPVLIDDMGFGLARATWPFVVDGGNGGGGHPGVAGHTWQLESGEGGFVGPDCFGFPDLAISTPGSFFK